MWTVKLGLIIALVRAHRILKRAGRKGAATAALSYAILTMVGNLTFDHIWQALYLTGCGFILAEVLAVVAGAGGGAGSGTRADAGRGAGCGLLVMTRRD